MGGVIEFPRRHTRASAGSASSRRRKSSAVTAPSVAKAIRSATARDGQPSSSQSCVMRPLDTPTLAAKSRRVMPDSSMYADSFMDRIFSPPKISMQVKVLAPADGQNPAIHRKFSMAKTKGRQDQIVQTRFKEGLRPTFIRAWRKKSGKTQTDVAEFLGVSTATISQIENGETGYKQEYLEGMAYLFGCEPADLLVRDPADKEAIWSLWDNAKPAQRKQIIGIIEGLLKSSAA